LLHRYFGRDGREEAESLLAPAIGETPIILAFLAPSMKPTPDWARVLYVYLFTDRDGKFQLCALADPASILWRGLAGSC